MNTFLASSLLWLFHSTGAVFPVVQPQPAVVEAAPAFVPLERVKREWTAKGWKFITERNDSVQVVTTWKQGQQAKDFLGMAKLKLYWVVLAGPFDVAAGKERQIKLSFNCSETEYHTFLRPDETQVRLDAFKELTARATAEGATVTLTTKLRTENGLDHKYYLVQQKADLIEDGKTLASWFTGSMASSWFVKP